jgi:hypothetical protein
MSTTGRSCWWKNIFDLLLIEIERERERERERRMIYLATNPLTLTPNLTTP